MTSFYYFCTRYPFIIKERIMKRLLFAILVAVATLTVGAQNNQQPEAPQLEFAL